MLVDKITITNQARELVKNIKGIIVCAECNNVLHEDESKVLAGRHVCHPCHKELTMHPDNKKIRNLVDFLNSLQGVHFGHKEFYPGISVMYEHEYDHYVSINYIDDSKMFKENQIVSVSTSDKYTAFKTAVEKFEKYLMKAGENNESKV